MCAWTSDPRQANGCGENAVLEAEQYPADGPEEQQINPDPAQQQALECLHTIHDQLCKPRRSTGLLGRMLNKSLPPVRGLYIWGGVGRGKTYLMDLFFNRLPLEHKRRLHFHRFMREIHAELKALPKSPDPLVVIAGRLAPTMRVLCLDEFHVDDIGDAMLLGRLLEALFANGVTLITTSNLPPQQLYKNGLQRDRFLPAIALIEAHTRVFHLDNGIDYRTEFLERAGVYHLTSVDGSGGALRHHFDALARAPGLKEGQGLCINNRRIEVVAEAEDVVWFDFVAICDTPRSAADYLEIASLYHTVFISDVPLLDEARDSATQRFIHLIDALYDHNVKVMISAAVPAVELYAGRRHTFAFQRTISRLQEMASHQYLHKAHNAWG